MVELRLDRLRIVGGQHRRVGEELGTAHERDPGIVGEPPGSLRIRRDEDTADPRRVHVHPAQRVAEFVDVAKPRFVVVSLARDEPLHVRGPGPLPVAVRPVDPGEDQVDLERDVGGVLFEHRLDGRPAETETLDTAPDHLVTAHLAPCQRILNGQHNTLVGEGPELDLHAGGGAVAQPAADMYPWTEQTEDARLRGGGQRAVADEQRLRLLGVDSWNRTVRLYMRSPTPCAALGDSTSRRR